MIKNMFSVLFSLVSWLKYPLYIVFGLIIIFYILVSINIIIGLIKGKRFKKGIHCKVKKHSFLRRILIDLPKQVASDKFDRDPEFFRHQRVNNIRRSSRKWKNNSDDT